MIKPAGFEASQGILTAAYLKDPTDKQWDDAADMKTWRTWMDKNMPGANQADANYAFAYSVSSLMLETLKRDHPTITKIHIECSEKEIPLLEPLGFQRRVYGRVLF